MGAVSMCVCVWGWGGVGDVQMWLCRDRMKTAIAVVVPFNVLYVNHIMCVARFF